nr:LOW QUALITY PROTEIN: insulin-like [Cherax quadricarinatus]
MVGAGINRIYPSSYPNSELELEPRRRLCGWRLANNLVYPPVGGKTGLQQQPEALKELFSDDDPSQSASRENEDSKDHLPFLTKMEALQMLRNRPRPKRGLSAECCQKVCSVLELVGYCY